MENVKYLEVNAGVRYWEDCYLNGVSDEEWRIFGRNGERWVVMIDITSGRIKDWPDHLEADIHYKVCDDGEYFLCDESMKRVKKYGGYYVPDEYLCPKKNGYGDYIIMKVGNDGVIDGWRVPGFIDEEWVNV